MKKIYTIITLLALVFTGLNVNAQIVSKVSHTVNKSTTHEYKIGDGVDVDVATGNKFVWVVTKSDGNPALGTDGQPCFEIYADRAGTLSLDIASVFNKKMIYVRWLANADEGETYIVKNTEKANGTDCSDDAINTKEVEVSIIENDFEISATKWDKAGSTTKTNNDCAIATENAVAFLVARNGGDSRAWTFEYEYKLTNNGTIVTDWSKGDVSTISWLESSNPIKDVNDIDIDSDKDEAVGKILISSAVFADFKDIDLRGDGNYKVEIRIVKATDFDMAPARNILDASNPPAECKAEIIINKIPESQEIHVD